MIWTGFPVGYRKNVRYKEFDMRAYKEYLKVIEDCGWKVNVMDSEIEIGRPRGKTWLNTFARI